MMALTTCTPRAHKEKGNAANVAFGSQIDHWLGLSLELLRCRRLISPFAAVTKKPAVLSPSSLSDSISSITSWGIRTVVICDFAFFAPVAITDTPCIWCMSVYAKKRLKKDLWCISPWRSLFNAGEIHLAQCEAQPDCPPGWASNHNVTRTYIMACSHDTQTHPEYQYRFLALSAIGRNVIHITATTEREAREQSPAGCVMVFAGRLPVHGGCDITTINYGDMTTVQEVAHV